MNQILNTKLIKNSFKQNYFKVMFVSSIIALCFFCLFYVFNKLQLKKEELISKSINNKYHIYKLFSYNANNSTEKDSDILGNISIPKINITYTFFSGINENLLKFSPCRFWGDFPNKKHNLCIAGHNYLNNQFFSQLNRLELNDLILIKDNYDNCFNYYVFDKFEILEKDISSILKYPLDYYELNLLTCTNYGNKRIVVKAKLKV